MPSAKNAFFYTSEVPPITMSTLQTILISAAAGAAAGAIAATLIMEPSAAPSARQMETDDGNLARQVVDLAAENDDFNARLSLLENRPLPLSGGVASASRTEHEALALTVAAGGTAPEKTETTPSNRELDREELDNAESAILAQREEAARLEKERVAREQRLESTRQAAAYWTTELELSTYQSEQMWKLLLTRSDAAETQRVAWESGADPAILSQDNMNIEATFQSGLRDLLTPEQLAKYTAAADGDG